MNNTKEHLEIALATLEAWMLHLAEAPVPEEQKKLIEVYIAAKNKELITETLEKKCADLREREEREYQREREREEREYQREREQLAREESQRQREHEQLMMKHSQNSTGGSLITPSKTHRSPVGSAETGKEQLLSYCKKLAEIETVEIDLENVRTVDQMKDLYNLNALARAYNITARQCTTVLSQYKFNVKEKAFQGSDSLVELCQNAQMSMVDTSGTGCIFSEPRVPTDESDWVDFDRSDTLAMDAITLVRLLGKPDCVHSTLPMFKEFKKYSSERELILQCLKRVFAISANHGGIFSGSACFAVTNNEGCFLITYRHSFSLDIDGNKRKRIYRIHAIRRADVGRLWLMFSSTPKFFHAQDGGAIVSVLKRISLNPYCCRVTPLSISSSRVYKVVVPKKRGKETFLSNISKPEYTFVLKLNDDPDRLEKEIAATRAIGEEHYKQDVPFHVHRVMTFQNNNFSTDAIINNRSTSMVFSQSIADVAVADPTAAADVNYLVNPCTEALKWTYSTAPHCFGALLMELGENLQDLSSRNLLGDITRSLALMHQAGYAHCDLRSPNLMKFSQFTEFQYRVIDFDLAVTMDGTVAAARFKVDRHSNQFKAFPVAAKNACDQDDMVLWLTSYDVAMFYECMLRKYQHPELLHTSTDSTAGPKKRKRTLGESNVSFVCYH